MVERQRRPIGPIACAAGESGVAIPEELSHPVLIMPAGRFRPNRAETVVKPRADECLCGVTTQSASDFVLTVRREGQLGREKKRRPSSYRSPVRALRPGSCRKLKVTALAWRHEGNEPGDECPERAEEGRSGQFTRQGNGAGSGATRAPGGQERAKTALLTPWLRRQCGWTAALHNVPGRVLEVLMPVRPKNGTFYDGTAARNIYGLL